MTADHPSPTTPLDGAPPGALPPLDASPSSARRRSRPAEAERPKRRRPVSLDPQELGFTPQKPVPWLAPLLLLNTGLRTLLATLFGAYLDKRELQNALSGESFTAPGRDGELWLDYVADLGDGFHATYSVAYLLAQPRLEVGGHVLPRGELLLMGGDQVYPVADGDSYENRTKGPYRTALPEQPADRPPTLFALPGNHDWYDGLTAFLRLFARRKDGHIGGWRTQQRRSYFAVKLPSDWWLFAIDEQFGAYIDDPQLLYFEKVANQVGPDDRIILMTPKPTWVKAADKPEEYDAVDYFLRTIIGPTEAHVRLLLSGDLHHYARYSGEDRELITCGGGGAYLGATHTLPPQLAVPPPETLTRNASRTRTYDLRSTFPDAPTSRRMGWGVFPRIPVRNPGFATMLGILQTLTMLAMSGAAAAEGGAFQRLFSIPLIFMCGLVLIGTVLFAQPPSAKAAKHARHWILGLLHGIAQLALAAGGTWVWLQMPFREWEWPGPLVVAVAIYLPVIGFVASQLCALYLLVASWFKVNVNELFAAQGIEDAKSFLRMHIAADGSLTVYVLGLDKICRTWVADPDGPEDASWVKPATPLVPRLVDGPFVLPDLDREN